MEQAAGVETMSSAMQEVSNYYDWMYAALAPRLGRSVLEIGPGYGSIAGRIRDAGKAYRAIDSDKGIIERLRPRLQLPEDHLAVGDITEPQWARTFPSAGVDTVLYVNVLEHVQDDVAFVKAAAKLAPRGRMVVMVPAMPSLYGSFDRQAGHYRRYSPSGLRRVMTEAGLPPKEVRYFNAVGAAIWFIMVRILNAPLNSEGTNSSILVYDRLVIPVARFLDPVLRWAAGQSLIAVADIP